MASGKERYSYLGPVGTFTWEALGQVSGAETGEWVSVNNVGEALDDVDPDLGAFRVRLGKRGQIVLVRPH